MHPETSILRHGRFNSYFDRLPIFTGLGRESLDTAVRICYYEPIGFDMTLSEEAIKKYYAGTRVPDLRSPHPGVLSWVMAVELLFDQAGEQLWGPLFNLIDGRLLGAPERAVPLRVQNKKVHARSIGMELDRVRLCLLDLPTSVVDQFFAPLSPELLARNVGSVEDELEAISRLPPIHELGAAAALALEAVYQHDEKRAQEVGRYAKALLPNIRRQPEMKRAYAAVKHALDEKCFALALSVSAFFVSCARLSDRSQACDPKLNDDTRPIDALTLAAFHGDGCMVNMG